jgi:hypothetical protein
MTSEHLTSIVKKGELSLDFTGENWKIQLRAAREKSRPSPCSTAKICGEYLLMFFAMTLASFVLHLQGALDLDTEADPEPPTFSESKALNHPLKELAVSIKPLGRAVSGEAFKFWVVIRNKGPKRVVLDLSDEDFITGYSFRPEHVPSGKPSPLISSMMFAETHSLEAGMRFCPAPPTVFALNPGDGFERLAEISSLRVKVPGKGRLSIDIRQLLATRDLLCGKASFAVSVGEVDITVEAKTSRSGSPR